MKLTSINGELFVILKINGRDQTLTPSDAFVAGRKLSMDARRQRDAFKLAYDQARAALGDAMLDGMGKEKAQKALQQAYTALTDASTQLRDAEAEQAALLRSLAGNFSAGFVKQARDQIKQRLQPFDLERFSA